MVNRKKKNPLDKHRSVAQSHLKEVLLQPAKSASAHRGPNKRFNHPNVKRGSFLAKQSRPQRQDFSIPRTDNELLQEIAGIRKVQSDLKRKIKK